MKRIRKLWLGLALLVVVAGSAYWINVRVQTRLGEQALAATDLHFLTLAAAEQKARTSGRPVLVDFSAIWCPTCRALHRKVFTDAEVKRAIQAHYELARVDYDAPDAPAFMQRYDVHAFPSLLVVDADGRLLRRLTVTMDPRAFTQALSF